MTGKVPDDELVQGANDLTRTDVDIALRSMDVITSLHQAKKALVHKSGTSSAICESFTSTMQIDDLDEDIDEEDLVDFEYDIDVVNDEESKVEDDDDNNDDRNYEDPITGAYLNKNAGFEIKI